MSYMTSYDLNIYDLKSREPANKVLDPRSIADLQDEIDRMGVFTDGDVSFDGLSAYSTWYDCDEDMCLLSSKFPDLLFELWGTGEDCDDLWKAYYCGGAKQAAPAKISYDEFDPTKLESPRNQRTNYSYED